MATELPIVIAGQVITPTWGNAVRDAINEVQDDRVLRAGDTMTGPLSISTPTHNQITLSNAAGQYAYIAFNDSGTRKGYVGKDPSGNIIIAADGAGVLHLSGDVRSASAQSTQPNGLTRKDYVDQRDVDYYNTYTLPYYNAANASITTHYNAAIAYADARLHRNGDTVNGRLTWNGDPFAGNHGTAIEVAAIGINTHNAGGSNLWSMHSGAA